MSKKYTYIFVSIAFIVLIAVLSGCKQTTGNKTFWYSSSSGFFSTNVIDRAQQETPYTLLLPKYLPDNIDPRKPNLITGPRKIDYKKDAEDLYLIFTYTDGVREIMI